MKLKEKEVSVLKIELKSNKLTQGLIKVTFKKTKTSKTKKGK